MPIGLEKLVLDTSAYSWMTSGDGRVLDLVANAEMVWVPTIVLGELEAGFVRGSRHLQNNRLLDEFLDEPFVSTRHVNRGVARHYGRLFAALREAGTPIPINDVWIAATTFECGGCLVTFDQHFRRIEGLDHVLLTAEAS